MTDIRGGDVIDLGRKKLEIIDFPGHTAGNILLLDRKAKICYAGDSIIEHPWLFLKESQPAGVYLESLKQAREILSDAGVKRIYNGHFNQVPLKVMQIGNMVTGLESILAGTAKGKPFENMVGKGTEYTFGEWSILCCENTNLPA